MIMSCRWLAVVLFSALLPGCGLVKGISPFAAKPECGPPTSMSDSDGKITTQEMKDPETPEDKNCYYTLQITDIDEKAGRATGQVPLSQVQRLAKEGDGFDLSNLTRRMTPIENYPRYKYNVQVEGGTTGLTKGEVAYFMRKPGSNALMYYSSDKVCAEKERMIRDHAAKNKYKPYDIPDEYIRECPNLEHMSWEKKTNDSLKSP